MTTPDDLPRSPSGRVPDWVVEERLLGRRPDTSFRPGPGPGPASPPPARRGRGRRRWGAAALVVVALVGAAGLWRVSSRSAGADVAAGPSPSSTPSAGRSTTPTRSAAAGSLSVGSSGATPGPSSSTDSDVLLSVPTPGRDERPTRVLPPVTPAKSSKAWRASAFQTDADGRETTTPVRWSPCRPIRYVVNPAGAPPGGAVIVDTAFRRISAATGLQFVAAGSSDEVVRDRGERALFAPGLYGDRWAPVLVSWSDATTKADSGSDIYWVSDRERPSVLVSAYVGLDAKYIRSLLSQRRGDDANAFVLASLAPVVGLSFVPDRSQLLAEDPVAGVRTFAAGDLTGLSVMGQGPCAPWL